MLQDSAAFARDYDGEETIVVDVPEVPPFPTQEALAEEEVPHIIILAKVQRDGSVSGDGCRHKLTPDRSEASCDMQFHAGVDYLVPEALTGNLCQRGCFTKHELAKAAKAEAARFSSNGESAPLRAFIDERPLSNGAKRRK